jgi:hypothetical protein
MRDGKVVSLEVRGYEKLSIMCRTHLDRRRGFLRSDDLFLRSRVGSRGGRLRVAHGVGIRGGEGEGYKST